MSAEDTDTELPKPLLEAAQNLLDAVGQRAVTKEHFAALVASAEAQEEYEDYLVVFLSVLREDAASGQVTLDLVDDLIELVQQLVSIDIRRVLREEKLVRSDNKYSLVPRD